MFARRPRGPDSLAGIGLWHSAGVARRLHDETGVGRGGGTCSFLVPGCGTDLLPKHRAHDGYGACDPGKEAVMSTVILDPEEWAEQEFAACELGDVRRNRRLITV